MTPRQKEIQAKYDKTGYKSLTASEKRTLTYGKLKDMGFSPSQAVRYRKNFKLIHDDKEVRRVKLVKFRQDRKKEIDKIVKDYYISQLGYTRSKAHSRRTHRKRVWKETINYLRENEVLLSTEARSMPKIPEILHDNGVRLLANTYHYLHPKERLDDLIDQLSNRHKFTSEKILRHQYRLERFIVTQDKTALAAFVETLSAQSKLDDYYKAMTKNSADNTIETDENEEE